MGNDGDNDGMVAVVVMEKMVLVLKVVVVVVRVMMVVVVVISRAGLGPKILPGISKPDHQAARATWDPLTFVPGRSQDSALALNYLVGKKINHRNNDGGGYEWIWIKMDMRMVMEKVLVVMVLTEVGVSVMMEILVVVVVVVMRTKTVIMVVKMEKMVKKSDYLNTVLHVMTRQ